MQRAQWTLECLDTIALVSPVVAASASNDAQQQVTIVGAVLSSRKMPPLWSLCAVVEPIRRQCRGGACRPPSRHHACPTAASRTPRVPGAILGVECLYPSGEGAQARASQGRGCCNRLGPRQVSGGGRGCASSDGWSRDGCQQPSAAVCAAGDRRRARPPIAVHAVCPPSPLASDCGGLPRTGCAHPICGDVVHPRRGGASCWSRSINKMVPAPSLTLTNGMRRSNACAIRLGM